MIELVWTEDLLAEVERVLVERKSLTSAQARYFCDCIREAFPRGRLDRSAYDHLIAMRVGPDPDDYVHSAAVVGSSVDVLLSPTRPASLTPTSRRLVECRPTRTPASCSPNNEDVVIETIRRMAVGRRVAVAPTEILAAIRRAGLVNFARVLRRQFYEFLPGLEV